MLVFSHCVRPHAGWPGPHAGGANREDLSVWTGVFSSDWSSCGAVKCCSPESLQLAMLKGDRIESATNCNAWMTHVSSITCICTNEYMPDVFGNLYMGSLQRLTMAHSGASSLYWSNWFFYVVVFFLGFYVQLLCVCYVAKTYTYIIDMILADPFKDPN